MYLQKVAPLVSTDAFLTKHGDKIIQKLSAPRQKYQKRKITPQDCVYDLTQSQQPQADFTAQKVESQSVVMTVSSLVKAPMGFSPVHGVADLLEETIGPDFQRIAKASWIVDKFYPKVIKKLHNTLDFGAALNVLVSHCAAYKLSWETVGPLEPKKVHERKLFIVNFLSPGCSAPVLSYLISTFGKKTAVHQACQRTVELLFHDFFSILMTRYKIPQSSVQSKADILDEAASVGKIGVFMPDATEDQYRVSHEASQPMESEMIPIAEDTVHPIKESSMQETPTVPAEMNLNPVPERNYDFQALPRTGAETFAEFVVAVSVHIPHVSICCMKPDDFLRLLVQTLAHDKHTSVQITKTPNRTMTIGYKEQPILSVCRGVASYVDPDVVFADNGSFKRLSELFWVVHEQGLIRSGAQATKPEQTAQPRPQTSKDSFIYESLLVFSTLFQSTYLELTKPKPAEHRFESNHDITLN